MTLDRSTLKLPACLIIMDGFGLAEASEGNAISQAQKPCLDALFSEHPHTRLSASGKAVGLPDGQMGNSEVGHLNIGAGRIVFQELTRINNACEDGSLAANPVLNEAFEHATAPGTVLHFMGLLSDGGVHSNNQHLYALLRAAKQAGVRQVFVHCFMDGRDVPPSSGIEYIRQLEDEIDAVSDEGFSAKIASISGRYYAMDRDNRWERVQRAWDVLVNGVFVQSCSPVEGMAASYEQGVTDEFVVPMSFDDRGMQDGDSLVFFNFRPDRAREITRSLVDEDFSGFERKVFPKLHYVCLTEYDPSIDAPVAFAKEFPDQVLADVLAESGLRQYHIAETEKYAHVTFFLNGGREAPKEGEQRKLIASPHVATYDLQPEMSEPEVASTLAAAIDADEADVYIVNFANPDMVGHTGVLSAAIAAIEAVDEGVSQVLAALKRKGGFAFITADHGNADQMIALDGNPHTAHTTAQVPFVFVDYAQTGRTLGGEEGALCDIAPTILDAMGVPAPALMTGRSLLL